MAAKPHATPGGQNQPAYLLLGEILRPHGLQGEVRVRILTDYPDRIPELEAVYIGRDPAATDIQRYEVEAMRMHQKYGLLKLVGVDDRNQADILRELFVMVDLREAVPLEDDEIYLYQLIGLTVQTQAGEILGKLSEVLETGANDVYIVASPTYGEILIPVTDETIIETDLDAAVVTVNLPDGLLPSP